MGKDERLERCLLGIALGDSLGLPMEGLKKRRVERMFSGPIRQRMCFGRGLLSDDTLMAVATIQAFHVANGDVDRFANELAKRLRTWFWCIPPGIGLATIKSCLKLTFGFGPMRSGVASAGNGPAIRAVVLGYLISDSVTRNEWIRTSTIITHTSKTAIEGSQILGLATTLMKDNRWEEFDGEVARCFPKWDWRSAWPESGPTGYILHTVNATIDCIKLSSQNLSQSIELAIRMGGDTDSVAALAGGICGSGPVDSNIPEGWINWIGWPHPIQISGVVDGSIKRLNVPAILAQHAISLLLIIPHIVKRALPPY